jgi:hypothetical protein
MLVVVWLEYGRVPTPTTQQQNQIVEKRRTLCYADTQLFSISDIQENNQ